MTREKCVLAYSGGLDTSVAIRWLAENKNVDVIALTVDLGEQEKDLDFIKSKALQVGAVKAFAYDVQREFAYDYIAPALWANAAYEGKYFLSTSLARPLIAKKLVEVAQAEGAQFVAHGCTGKGNDQVRFDITTAALAPGLQVLAPAREWGWSREEELDYAERHNIPVPVGRANPFSTDVNLYGRSCEAGVLEDPWREPPEEAYAWTTSPQKAPDDPENVEIGFAQGTPVSLDGQPLDLVTLIRKLNRLAGKHGVGRVDHVENRLVGIKSREVYELPAATVLTLAHRELECLTLPRELHHAKLALEHQFAELIYYGLWFHPLRDCLQAFFAKSQETVTGTVRMRLFKGTATATGRTSPYTLYSYDLATYDKADKFDHRAAEGFISIFGLPTRVFAAVQKARSEGVGR